MKQSTQKLVYAAVLMAVLAVIIVYAYFQMTSKPRDETPKTKVEKLVNRNLEGNYPATPREVVKAYGELTKYLYNRNEEPKVNEKQFEALFDQVRLLYSKELLDKNPREEHLNNLIEDVAYYEKQSKTIMSYTVQQSSQVETGKLEGEDVAKVDITFTTKASGEQPARTHEQVLLREEDGRWKIVGWQQIGGAADEE